MCVWPPIEPYVFIMQVGSLRACLVTIAVLAGACGTQGTESSVAADAPGVVVADAESSSSLQERADTTETTGPAQSAESTAAAQESASPSTTGLDPDAITSAPTSSTPSSEATETTSAPTTAASTTEPPTTVAPTTEAPAGDFVNLVGGGQLDLNSIEGTDTVLWFWAPW